MKGHVTIFASAVLEKHCFCRPHYLSVHGVYGGQKHRFVWITKRIKQNVVTNKYIGIDGVYKIA